MVISFHPSYIDTMYLARIEGILCFWCCIVVCWSSVLRIQDVIAGIMYLIIFDSINVTKLTENDIFLIK